MAVQLPLFTIPGLTAGSDLSDHQFKFVTFDSDRNVELADTSGDEIVGILQNSPEEGDQAQIMVAGISKVQVDNAGITAGDSIVGDNDGVATSVTFTDNTEAHQVIGQAYDDADADSVGSILFSALQTRLAE